jgi:hypothetical protein
MTDIHALANRVLNDRLQRCVVVGATVKGRTMVEFTGEPTAAEVEWEALKCQLRTT